MKRTLIAIFSMSCFTLLNNAMADTRALQNQLQQLENEIAQLESQYNKKTAELQQCQKSGQNFKVAGIATLAGTGAGVIGNIALHKKYAEKNGKNSSSGSSAPLSATAALDANMKKYCDAATGDKKEKMCAYLKKENQSCQNCN